MQRYFLELSFSGMNYSGWQRQKNGKSVQEELDRAISTLLQDDIQTQGCGRTDKGVHAEQFYVHFDTDRKIPKKWVFKLNRFLPADIAIHEVYKVTADQHARFDAISRTYKYIISYKKDPFLKNEAMFIYKKLDLKKLNEASRLLLKHEDFQCFSRTRTSVKNFICNITEVKWIEKNDRLIFYITANRFLRGMVRAIVGTLIKVGSNEITKDAFTMVIKSKDRRQAGSSVTASGLSLVNLEYPFKLKPL